MSDFDSAVPHKGGHNDLSRWEQFGGTLKRPPPAAPMRAMPDWMPRDSAWRYPEGTRKHGSTGQLFEVRNGQWIRIEENDGRGAG